MAKARDLSFDVEEDELDDLHSLPDSDSIRHNRANSLSSPVSYSGSYSNRSRSGSVSNSQNNSQCSSPIKQVVALSGGSKNISSSNNQAFEAVKSPKSRSRSSLSNNNNNSSSSSSDNDSSLIDDMSGSDARNKKVWVAKNPTHFACCCEVLAQEKIRLFSPTQTQFKTRLSLNDENKLGVVAEKVNFSGLDQHNGKLSEQALLGLGGSAAFALLFNETDFKEEHVDAKTGLKIDGDWFYSTLTGSDVFKGKDALITTEEIMALPYIVKYKANQWLDLIEDGVNKKITNKLKYFNLNNNPQVREGVNQVILLCAVTPLPLIHKLNAWYVVDSQYKEFSWYKDIQTYKDKISQVDSERMKLFVSEGIKTASFKQYAQSEKAQHYLNAYKKHIRSFLLTGAEQLVEESEYPGVKTEIDNQFKRIQNLTKPTASSSSSSNTIEKNKDDKAKSKYSVGFFDGSSSSTSGTSSSSSNQVKKEVVSKWKSKK
jgi:hypothetical protein